MTPPSRISVLDFSALLPGPLTTLLRAEAGAEATMVERVGGGEMRSSEPKFGAASVNFALLDDEHLHSSSPALGESNETLLGGV